MNTLQINGTKTNALFLTLNDSIIGKVDIDHQTITVYYSKEEFEEIYGKHDLNKEANAFLNEEAHNYDFSYDFTVYFRVYFDEEQEEYFYEEC